MIKFDVYGIMSVLWCFGSPVQFDLHVDTQSHCQASVCTHHIQISSESL